MITFISIADAKPKKEISVKVKVISDVRFTSRDILKCRVGDESAIAEIIAWGNEKERMKFKKGDVIEVVNVVVSEKSPLFIFTKKTEVKVINAADIPDEKIYATKFIDEIPAFGYVFIEGFVSRNFGIYDYYCRRCRKFSEEVCSCGNFSEKIFRISGIFSDSTSDILWTTNDERVAEKITNRKAEELKAKRTKNKGLENEKEHWKEIIKKLMNHNHKFFGYGSDKKFIVVDAEC